MFLLHLKPFLKKFFSLNRLHAVVLGCLFFGMSSVDVFAFETEPPHRCGTLSIVEQWQQNGGAGLPGPMDFYASRTERTDLNSYQSPSGRFLFWYTLEGSDAIPPNDTSGSGIPDRVEIAALAADEAWDVFVQQLGFRNAVPDDAPYEFFFANLGFYGQTSLSNNAPFSVIDSTFDWVPGNDYEDDAIGALKVTIAHEFYHAIQFAYNQWQGPSAQTAWLEMDAVTAEHLVFPQVSEYLNFIGQNSIFQTPGRSTPSAFDHTTWFLYFPERFEANFFRHVWEIIEENPDITMTAAIEEHLINSGTELREEIIRLYLWHLAAGNWSREDYGFQQAERYPTSFKRSQFSVVPTQPYPMWSVNKLATNFHAVIPAETDEGEIVIAFFSDHPESGAGLLFYFEDGSVQERILQPADDGMKLYRTGINWEDIQQLGIATANTGTEQNRLYQLLVGAGDGIEQIKYGDTNSDGAIGTNDVSPILDFLVGNESGNLTFTQKFAAETSGNMVITAYDAALIYKKASGFINHFPADLNQSGFGPELSRFEPPAALSSPKNTPTPKLTLLPPEDANLDEIGITVRIMDFPEPILSVELDLLFTSSRVSFSQVSTVDSGFNELMFAENQDGDRLDVVWASNSAASSNQAGTIIFFPENEGDVFISIVSARINEYDGPLETTGTSFTVEDNPPVPISTVPEHPTKTKLMPNYPNPFNPTTVIPFQLAESGFVSLQIYDINGRLIRDLANGTYYHAGNHSVTFNATGLASGLYIARLKTNNNVFTRSLTLVQ